MAPGKSVPRVFDDYRRFIGLVHARRSDPRIVFIRSKSSYARWSLRPSAQKANDFIHDLCASDNRPFLADPATPLLGPDGLLAADLFLPDRLHLNGRGYAVRNKALAPVPEKILLFFPGEKAEKIRTE